MPVLTLRREAHGDSFIRATGARAKVNPYASPGAVAKFMFCAHDNSRTCTIPQRIPGVSRR
jgi:hypothetical protein